MKSRGSIGAMRLRHLEIFHAVMQSGTVKGAASLLHITQPAATRLLQQAERHLGFSLFDRVKGRLVPTHEARLLYPEVEQLYLKLDTIRRLARNLADGENAMLRILCVPALAQDWLPDALAAMQRKYPQARFAVRTLHSRQIAESLALREADLGFAFEAPDHPAIAAEAIAHGHLVCVGTQSGTGISLAQLARRTVIDLDPEDPLGRALHGARLAQGLEFESRVLVHSYHAAIAMARQGLGSALVDSFTGRIAERAGGLHAVPITPPIELAVHAMRCRDQTSSALARQLIATMQRVLAG